ncbi:MAG: D-glycero-beta-D-manno-heptose-7-phosphate kinase [Limnobacter sp.]|nr:D-glycero-beta-D-manno-heptose-7-phosphate kinase [Limnobacter sp.]
MRRNAARSSNVDEGGARIDFSAARLLIVGDLMLDRYWFGEVERVSPEAPVPVVLVQRSEERLGGAANVALNAATLGAPVTLVGIVGNDEPGRRVAELAAERGIDARLEVDPTLPTTIKLRVIGRQQQLLRIDFERNPDPGVLERKLELLRTLVAGNGIVVLSDYGKGGLAQIREMIRVARAAGRTTIVDPKGDDWDRYAGASVLTPNRAELRQVVGRWSSESDLLVRVQQLRARLDLEYLLLTRSEEGMTLFSDEGALTVPAQAREVYDVSGAGDTVVAVLAAMLAAGWPIADAVRLANRAGGIVVGKLGTAAVLPEELFE